MEFFIGIFFVVWLAMFVWIVGSNIAEWCKNNASPRLSVDARVVTKRNAITFLAFALYASSTTIITTITPPIPTATTSPSRWKAATAWS